MSWTDSNTLLDLTIGKSLSRVLFIQILIIALLCGTSHQLRLYKKIEKIQERALRFLYNDHRSSYIDLLSKSERCIMHVSRLRALCIEVFKTLKNLNPSFMHEIFIIKSSTYSSRNPNDLQHYRPNQVTFGSNSLQSLGPQIWNGLPNEIKSAENLNSFKHLIKKWDGPSCKCSACQHVIED